ncbi:winged helix-turn-helix transcriptional regulator [Cedecea sp.]|uniref:HVO_A0114 family putative DNA-binding protein n=1 Tax=Cedecea sp. TaxID=1970739 RepID=UPI002F3F224B
MTTLTVRVMSRETAREDTKAAFVAAMSGQPVDVPFSLTFPDIESLAKTMLAPNRLAIINTMTGAEAISIRELARRVGRDFRAVHRDVTALLKAGVIEHDGQKIIFPYTAYHVEFTVGHIAA